MSGTAKGMGRLGGALGVGAGIGAVAVFGMLMAALAVGAVVFLALLAIRGLWAWVLPDLFPGAVQQGLIAAELSWAAAGKLALLLVVSGIFLNLATNRGSSGS